MFGEDCPSDFKGLLSEGEFKEGYLLPVLCEGCGYIWVDPKGKKVNKKEEDNE
jgi:hypothetical protein